MARFLRRKRVYDPVQRLLHAWIALLTILLTATGLYGSQQEAGGGRAFTWDMHMLLGNILIVGFVGRLVWGLLGPPHAKWRALFYPRALWLSMRRRKVPSVDGSFGHHPVGGITYVAFYGLTVSMVFTGLNLAGRLHGEGPMAPQVFDHLEDIPLLRSVHEYGMWFIAAFMVAHVGALIWHEHKDEIPVAQSMVSGYQYRTIREGQDETDV